MAIECSEQNIDPAAPQPDRLSEDDVLWLNSPPESPATDLDILLAAYFKFLMRQYFRPIQAQTSDGRLEQPSGTSRHRRNSQSKNDLNGQINQEVAAKKEGTSPRGQLFPSGRIPRGQPGIMARRLNDNRLAQLSFSVIMAEAGILREYSAQNATDKDTKNQRIAYVVGLDRAVQEGLIDGYVICWPKGRYPKTAHTIRLRVPGGRRARAKALGDMEQSIQDFMGALTYVPETK